MSKKCKGRIYKLVITDHTSSGVISFQRTFMFIREKSCKGCKECEVFDYATKISNGNDLVDGAMYKLKMIDDKTAELIKIKDK